MITSAHDICTTRLCRAADCTNEAENYSRLCWRCHQRDNPRIHTPPPRLEPTLWCSQCRHHKPDTQFAMRATTDTRSTKRRGRFYACLGCEAQARRHERAKRKKRAS